ncbi:MAG: thioredoxin-disulfide reductase [Patescibacteria group bacterium]
MLDVIIIGAGPAGLTAAIYTSRRSLSTLIISADIGGQVIKTYDIENYPGFDNISGLDLISKFREQATKFGAKIENAEVKKIEPKNGTFIVSTASASYDTKSIILAFGKKPRELAVPGEEKLKGHGISYCATCDAPFYKGRDVAVIGGGSSALDAALLLSKYASRVYIIHRTAEFRGEQHLIDRLKSNPNIEIIFNTEVLEIKGDNTVTSVILKDGKEIPVGGVMVEVGYVVDRKLAEGLVNIDQTNQIIVDNRQQTSVPGIFAAGDLTQTPYKQVVISAGEGAKAALSAFDYIQKLEGKKGIIADWH